MLDEQPDMPEEERAKYTHISLEKSMRLGELINEFFEITRFNLQDIVLEKGKVNLSIMLEQLADESYAVLAEKTLTCSIHTDDGLIVNGDPDKLARVFDNLLRNAIAYSYPGTNIDIQAYCEMNTIVITFTNQGDQIPQQKLSSIFEKFYRVEMCIRDRFKEGIEHTNCKRKKDFYCVSKFFSNEVSGRLQKCKKCLKNGSSGDNKKIEQLCCRNINYVIL